MDKFTKQFSEYAKNTGCDLLGIAPIERFAGLKPECHPASIFPEVKSVIVVGKRITRGSLRGVEEGTQFNTYQLYGYSWLEDRFLSITSLKLAEFLEDNKWEAVPMFNLPSEITPMGIPVRPGMPAPNVLLDFDDAAVRAGLGEIGYLRTFVSPEFGARQRFFVILTDAPLAATPVSSENICERSKDFKKYCPLGAIDTEKEEFIEIAGKKMKVAKIDFKKCAECKNGAIPNRRHPSGRPDRLAAVCMRTYMVHLEKKGSIKNRFANPFRTRPAWEIRGDRAIIEEGSEIE
jgi:Pyruvate/2-oxoacid:ferredoxin oxidoreductase delta subunit